MKSARAAIVLPPAKNSKGAVLNDRAELGGPQLQGSARESEGQTNGVELPEQCGICVAD